MDMISPSDRAIHGIENFVSNYIQLSPDDGVLLYFEEACRQAVGWLVMALRVREQPYKLYRFSHRDDNKFAAELEQHIAELRANSSVRRIIILVCEKDNLSFTLPLRRRASEEDLVIRRLLSCVPELFDLAFGITPQEQKYVNASVLTRLLPARSMRIRNELGTDLEIQLNNDKYKWVSNFGIPGLGELIVLPPGEVNTFPAAISGRFVAQGALNYNYAMDFDVRLQGRPVTIDIENGMVRHFECPDPRIQDFLKQAFADPLTRNVGELGVGTNIGIDRFLATKSHINERHPGVHLGFGQHGQPGKVSYQALAHLDVISTRDMIEVRDGGEPIDTNAFLPIFMQHPPGTHCEDVEHSL